MPGKKIEFLIFGTKHGVGLRAEDPGECMGGTGGPLNPLQTDGTTMICLDRANRLMDRWRRGGSITDQLPCFSLPVSSPSPARGYKARHHLPGLFRTRTPARPLPSTPPACLPSYATISACLPACLLIIMSSSFPIDLPCNF